MTAPSRRVASGLLAAALALAAAGGARAEEFLGPDNSFSLNFDEQWKAIQAQNRAGVTCTPEACGADRVFCLMLPRTDAGAVPGKPLPDALVEKFGAGIVRSAPAGLKADYAAPFAPRTLGSVSGSWGEITARGDAGALRFAIFLYAAPGFDIAFNCVTPEARWETHKPKIEKLLSSLTINPAPATPTKPPK